MGAEAMGLRAGKPYDSALPACLAVRMETTVIGNEASLAWASGIVNEKKPG